MASIDENRATEPEAPKLRVLVVEDEDAARIATTRYLQNCGHEVAAAGTVSEALEKADELQPDVLVCDWKLSGKCDGVDVARLLQRRYGVAVIFVTAYALDDLRRQSTEPMSSMFLRRSSSA